jgi:multidrug efflux pump subunit AcrB
MCSQEQYFVLNVVKNIRETPFLIMVHVPNAFCEHMLGKYFASFVTLSVCIFLMYRLIGITVV